MEALPRELALRIALASRVLPASIFPSCWKSSIAVWVLP